MIKYDYLNQGSNEEWLAHSFSEYLSARADDYSNVINVLDAAVQADFDAEIDEVTENFNTVMDDISSLIVAEAESLQIDLSNMDSSSSEYVETINTIVQSSEEIQEIIEQNFEDSENVIENFGNFISPEVRTVDVQIDVNRPSFVPTENAPLLAMYSEYGTVVANKADSLLADLGIPNCNVSLGGGYVRLKDLVAGVIANVNASASNTTEIVLPLTTIDGNDAYEDLDSSLRYSFTTLSEELKANYASTLAFAGGFLASAQENVADKLSTFTNYLTDKIDNAKVKISATAGLIKDRLSSAGNSVVSFFKDFIHLTGWDRFQSHQEQSDTIDQSILYQYTGCSPVPVLDFHNALIAIDSTVRTIGAVAAALVTGMVTLAAGGFWTIQRWIQDTFVNPFDIYSLNNNSTSSLIDGFQYQKVDDVLTHNFQTEQELNDVVVALRKYEGCFIGFKGIFAEQFVHIKSIVPQSSGDSEYPYQLAITVDNIMKPRCIDRYVFDEICQSANSRLSGHYQNDFYITDIDTPHLRPSWLSGSYHYLDVSSILIGDRAIISGWWDDVLTQCKERSDLYPGIENYTVDYSTQEVRYNEQTMCIGYALGAALHSIMLTVAKRHGEVEAGSDKAELLNLQWWNSNSWGPLRFLAIPMFGYTATNIQFVQAACGYDSSLPEGDQFYRIPLTLLKGISYATPETPITYIPVDLSFFMSMFISSAIDRYYNPLNYGFIPFSNNTTDFSLAQYGIHTDAENAQAVTRLITALIIIVTVAIVATTAVTLVRRFTYARFFKKQSFVGRMDNKMWSGGTLTAAEQRKYVRYSRKLNNSSLLTKGTNLSEVVSDSSDGVLNSLGSKIDTIYCSITGQEKSPLTNFLPSKDSAENTESSIHQIGRLISGNYRN